MPENRVWYARAHRLLQPSQFAECRADHLRRGKDEHLVAMLDDRIAVRQQGAPAPVKHGDTCLDTDGEMLAHGAQRPSDQQSALIGGDADQRHTTVGKIDDLQRLGIGDEPRDIGGHQLFRAQRMVHREIVFG